MAIILTPVRTYGCFKENAADNFRFLHRRFLAQTLYKTVKITDNSVEVILYGRNSYSNNNYPVSIPFGYIDSHRAFSVFRDKKRNDCLERFYYRSAVYRRTNLLDLFSYKRTQKIKKDSFGIR